MRMGMERDRDEIFYSILFYIFQHFVLQNTAVSTRVVKLIVKQYKIAVNTELC